MPEAYTSEMDEGVATKTQKTHYENGNGSAEDEVLVSPEVNEAQWELIALGIKQEEAEEAKVGDVDGHEIVSGGSMSAEALDQEADELVDGNAGQEAGASEDDEAYTESQGETNGASTALEVEGRDPRITESEMPVPPPPGVLTVEEAMDTESLAIPQSVEAEISELLEIVHGRDDRVRVYGTTRYPWRTICKLEITAADGSRWRCSGAFIGPRTVLTNGHCVYMHKRGGWVKQVRVIPGKNGSGEPFGSAVGTFYHSVKGWTKSRSSNYDYAVIVLPSNKKLGNRVGWMGLANLSYFSLLGLRVNNSGYPGDKPGNYQWWNANNILAVTSRRVYYRIDTFGGQSGSPVWRYKNQKRHIVAVHNTGGSPFNGAVRIVKPVFNNLVSWKNKYK